MQGSGTANKNDYDLIEVIGKGSYGTVYKAKVKKTAELVAVKVIDLEQDWLPLLAEVNMVIDLRHETIVNYYAWFFENRRLWLVMEFCDGGSLSDIMHILKRPLTEAELSSVLRGVLKGLVYVHSLNRIHRDIKAGNLLLTSNGLVKLCDFGVSAQLDNSIAKTGTRIGSPYWMAPEVILSTGHNTKADIWSFGITALELFMQRPPLFDMAPTMALLKIPQQPSPEAPANASQLFKNFIKRTLIKDPEQRPTADELLKDPFITQVPERNATEIIRNLVSDYNQEKANFEEEEDEEESTDDEDDDDDAFGRNFTAEDARTILFNSDSSGTFLPVESGTMVVQDQGEGQKSKLADWEPKFIDTPSSSEQLAQRQKRHFRNFGDKDLKIMLKSIKAVAESSLKEGTIDPNEIRNNYNDVRKGIMEEFKRRNMDVPDDFEVLH
ncbi:Serine/threonine-protein kinase 4 [Tritrichomonas foetus]|uniref:non-specific serine/threonine protein kinase n=1 Tax=Tritrichomonas foetus TaxID=1144522 RepID=A0A1J4JFQ3_9EUKA|nr:Serine/threonine-protein kinase 4 [Tritrichomonas foetus]|eukprot:OHS97489.1 Serine/threonine-protein kinase 4 [Tritrichomonas foetus]